jgi:hypothetical protein
MFGPQFNGIELPGETRRRAPHSLAEEIGQRAWSALMMSDLDGNRCHVSSTSPVDFDPAHLLPRRILADQPRPMLCTALELLRA